MGTPHGGSAGRWISIPHEGGAGRWMDTPHEDGTEVWTSTPYIGSPWEGENFLWGSCNPMYHPMVRVGKSTTAVSHHGTFCTIGHKLYVIT